MSDWLLWFQTGFEHILDVNGYDHMLFISLLVLTYPVTEWKKLAGLITAFTLGHSLTLILSVSNIIFYPQIYIEVLIMLTIIVAALYLLFNPKNTPNRVSTIYLIICFFGLVHGMGFSYLLKSMLGHNQIIVVPLLMFNLGLEAGQLIFVVLVAGFLYLVGKYTKAIETKLKTGFIALILAVAFILFCTRIINIIT